MADERGIAILGFWHVQDGQRKVYKREETKSWSEAGSGRRRIDRSVKTTNPSKFPMVIQTFNSFRLKDPNSASAIAGPISGIP